MISKISSNLSCAPAFIYKLGRISSDSGHILVIGIWHILNGIPLNGAKLLNLYAPIDIMSVCDIMSPC